MKHLERGDSQSFQAIALTSVKEAVLKKADFKGLDAKQQRQLIDLWLDKKEGLVGLQTLTLTNLTEIKAKALETLLKRSPHLQSLRLMGLPQITTLSCLEKVGQSLRTLYLYQMNGLVNYAGAPFFSHTSFAAIKNITNRSRTFSRDSTGSAAIKTAHFRPFVRLPKR